MYAIQKNISYKTYHLFTQIVFIYTYVLYLLRDNTHIICRHSSHCIIIVINYCKMHNLFLQPSFFHKSFDDTRSQFCRTIFPSTDINSRSTGEPLTTGLQSHDLRCRDYVVRWNTDHVVTFQTYLRRRRRGDTKFENPFSIFCLAISFSPLIIPATSSLMSYNCLIYTTFILRQITDYEQFYSQIVFILFFQIFNTFKYENIEELYYV